MKYKVIDYVSDVQEEQIRFFSLGGAGETLTQSILIMWLFSRLGCKQEMLSQLMMLMSGLGWTH